MKVGNKSTIDSVSFDTRKKQLEAEKKAEQEALAEQKKKDRQSPFNNYAQLNLNNIDYLISLNKLNQNALNMLLFMIQQMDQYNALICSQATLMEQFDLSRSTVARCIAELKKLGFIHVEKTGTFNIYYINKNLAWKSWGSNVKYCKFPDNIFLKEPKQHKSNKSNSQKIIKDRTPRLTLPQVKDDDYYDNHPFD